MNRPDYISPSRVFTSSHPSQEVLVEDLVTSNIPQIYDSSVDIISLWSYTLAPSLFAIVLGS
jgi:hypothetical protein